MISNAEAKAAPCKAVTLLRRGSSHSLFTLDEEEESKNVSGEDIFTLQVCAGSGRL